MRTYKETLGIIKRAAGPGQAFENIMNGMSHIPNYFGQAAQAVQPVVNTGTNLFGGLGGILGGLALGTMFSGGLNKLFDRFKDMDVQKIGDQVYDQVKARVKGDIKAAGQNAWNTVKKPFDAVGDAWQDITDASDWTKQMNNINTANPSLQNTMKNYNAAQKDLPTGQQGTSTMQNGNKYWAERQRLYDDQVAKLRAQRDKMDSWRGTLGNLFSTQGPQPDPARIDSSQVILQ